MKKRGCAKYGTVSAHGLSDVSFVKAKPDIVEKFDDLSDETHFPIVEVGKSDLEQNNSEKKNSQECEF